MSLSAPKGIHKKKNQHTIFTKFISVKNVTVTLQVCVKVKLEFTLFLIKYFLLLVCSNATKKDKYPENSMLNAPYFMQKDDIPRGLMKFQVACRS